MPQLPDYSQNNTPPDNSIMYGVENPGASGEADFKAEIKQVVQHFESGGGGLQVNNALDYSGADGGEMIQAAIDDLTAGVGGIVYIPADGPDNGVTTGAGTSEDNKWAVSSTITVSDHGVRLFGDMSGGDNPQSGTHLVATGAIGDMLLIDQGTDDLLQFHCHDMYIDGGENVSTAVRVGASENGTSGDRVFDPQFHRVMIQHATSVGFHIDKAQNVWYVDGWVERIDGTGAIGVKIDTSGSGRNTYWITQTIFAGNTIDITTDSNVDGGLWVTFNRTSGTDGAFLQINAQTQNAFVMGNFQSSNTNNGKFCEVNANVTGGRFCLNQIEQCTDGFHDTVGGHSDLEILGNRINAASGTEFNGITDANGWRVLFAQAPVNLGGNPIHNVKEGSTTADPTTDAPDGFFEMEDTAGNTVNVPYYL